MRATMTLTSEYDITPGEGGYQDLDTIAACTAVDAENIRVCPEAFLDMGRIDVKVRVVEVVA